MIQTNLVKDLYMMLHTKYLSSSLYGFREEDFLSFHYISLCKTSPPQGGANFGPRVMILTNLVKDLYIMMLHTRYLSSSVCGLRGEDFLSFHNISLCKTRPPQGGANFDPRVMILTNLVKDLYMMLHTIYLSSSLFGF